MKFRKQTFFLYILLSIGALVGIVIPCVGQEVVLENERIKMSWTLTSEGYSLSAFGLKAADGFHGMDNPIGSYRFLYSASKPDSVSRFKDYLGFPDPSYRYLIDRWRDGLLPVALDEAGKGMSFFPTELTHQDSSRVSFFQRLSTIEISSTWTLVSDNKGDVIVEMNVKALKPGYYSFKSPLIAAIDENQLEWGTIPGYVHSNKVNDDFIRAYGYGHGLTALPVVVRERGAGTLAPMMTTKDGLTLAMVAYPGLGRDPWKYDSMTNSEWSVGMSLMTENQQISPVLTYPILGNSASYLEKDSCLTFKFVVSLSDEGWFSAFENIVYDYYRLDEQIAMRKPLTSLTSRLNSMKSYVTNDSLSKWRVEEFNGKLIGAQEYHGGVLESDRDAMKNSDYGAMWMLAHLTQDSVLLHQRLAYARNFKLAQQDVSSPFFSGAVLGQYFLWKSKRFVEEWGNYVEPIAVTYYTMLDIGNMLLFESDDQELRSRLALGAQRLLDWQLPDGSWYVAYDKDEKTPLFNDLKDFRPTFYGLLVAYRIFKEEKYLSAARAGADWFYENGVKNGYLLGVCGDTRFVPDFATAQSAQAFLDLYELTDEQKYKEAAIMLARIYTSSIITHPIPSASDKLVSGIRKQDWQITQAGLNFEHGGLLGSSNWEGPILLASHAGMFTRMTQLTGDSLFVDLARAAAWGRDAFVDLESSVASYYWKTMDRGPGPYPHHAWWQVGWIMDYLVSEVTLRSGGQIQFPSGFITPKVGPHKPYGFENGTAFGEPVKLFMPEGIISIDNPTIDWIGAKGVESGTTYLYLLNNSVDPQTFTLKVDQSKRIDEVLIDAKGLRVINLDNLQQ